jgi:hypothetical protein
MGVLLAGVRFSAPIVPGNAIARAPVVAATNTSRLVISIDKSELLSLSGDELPSAVDVIGWVLVH